MPTYIQLLKKKRKRALRKTKTPALKGCPQKCGFILRISRVKPKKPNSAQRKVVKIKLSTDKIVLAYLPGMNFEMYPQMYATILLRGGRVRDLPGIHYKLIRGVLELERLFYRRNSRSKYGVRRASTEVIKYPERSMLYFTSSFIFLKSLWPHIKFFRGKYVPTFKYV